MLRQPLEEGSVTIARCDDTAVQKYLAKLSGPLFDRIDLHVAVSRVSFHELMQARATDGSTAIRARVEAARSRQSARLRDTGVSTNAAIAPADVRRFCALGAHAIAC